ncbi:hypothetical protein BH09MYX1_BH09MYX1_48090 [soil metagenome]
MAKARRLKWVATVGAEGGPVMLADLPDFGQWTGAAPYAELRKLNPKAAASTKDRMRTLHYWGQFTDRLPPPFTAASGHQYLQFATEAEAQAKLTDLTRAVKKKHPTVQITEDDQQTHFLLPGDDEDAQMWAELSPKSEYDASWQANQDEESWVHTFGKSARALFWDMGGPGATEIGVSADGTEIVLLRTWVDEESQEKEAKALVDTASESEAAAGEFAIPSGKAIVISSPIAPFQLEGLKSPGDLLKLGDGPKPPELDTDDMGGVGTVIKVKAGRWVVTTGTTEDDDDDDDAVDDEDDEDDEDADEDDDDDDSDDDEDEDEDEDEDDEDEDDGGDSEGSGWSCRWMRLKWVG